MNELYKQQYFLSEAEFLVCNTAAGARPLCPPGQKGEVKELSKEAAAEAVFSLVNRGLMTASGNTFVLGKALSDSFRVIAESGRVLIVYHQRFDTPDYFLYGSARGYVRIGPGAREAEYAGVLAYGAEELTACLADMGVTIAETLTDELLRGVEDELEFPMESAVLRAFLKRAVWPVGAQGGTELDVPDGVLAYLEVRTLKTGALSKQIFVLSDNLFNKLVIGTAQGAQEQLYRNDLLTELVYEALCGEEEKVS